MGDSYKEDLKSLGPKGLCRFESGSGHHYHLEINLTLLFDPLAVRRRLLDLSTTASLVGINNNMDAGLLLRDRKQLD